MGLFDLTTDLLEISEIFEKFLSKVYLFLLLSIESFMLLSDISFLLVNCELFNFEILDLIEIVERSITLISG